VPIVERSARQCFDTFAGHVRRLVAATLCPYRHVHLEHVGGTDTATLTFCEPNGTAAEIKLGYGNVWFFASQELTAVREEPRRWRLRTTSYGYRLQSAAQITVDNALLRWEYDAGAAPDGFCRHHVHAPLTLPLLAGKLDLDKAHVPTGWVTLEEVIRFLIVELGHKPPCGARWPSVLADSERAFYEDFTGKRYQAPGPKR
jgi:hypothetical protein